jgi:hypothetical protein
MSGQFEKPGMFFCVLNMTGNSFFYKGVFVKIRTGGNFYLLSVMA